ncbi:MAG: ABC transporter permease subunit [Treponema sp.]|nr:ABC transporter permease subunit [Treponema sp.]
MADLLIKTENTGGIGNPSDIHSSRFFWIREVGFNGRVLLPVFALGLNFFIHWVLPIHPTYRPKPLPFFKYFLEVLIIYHIISAIVSLFITKYRIKQADKALFLCVTYLFLGVYNSITIKFNLIPSLYFPAPERIIGVFVTDWFFLLRCLVYSMRLLLGGFFIGAFLGVITGTLIGWSKRWNYWVMPFIRVVGPIPSTAWIPIALVIFLRPTDASLFLIALGVWFPTTVLTSSGIMNVNKNYFEVSSTLGSGALRDVLFIALPAAAPNIFTGLFNGTSACFLTLMAAEMIGCKFGIGWYINWQRETLAYSNVYAALVVIALTFSFLIGLQFKIRNRVLSWQKGTIRW